MSRALRVLLAWELGANLGHVLRLELVAKVLRERGHAVIWAVPDPSAVEARLGSEAGEMLRIPTPVIRSPGDETQPCCYAEILATHGFGDDQTLDNAMLAWRRLLGLARPDVMLADHTPLGLLAARLHGVPTAHVATGWESPPFAASLPILRPGLARSKPGFVASLEAALVARINRLCEAKSAPPLASLGELYRAQATLLAAWPETDHFDPRPDRPWFPVGDPRRQASYIGPLFAEDYGPAMAWPDGVGPRVFVYMPRSQSAIDVVGSLIATGARVIAAIPGLTDSDRGMLSGPRCRVHAGPVRLAELLAEAQLVVSHGGHGLVAASLLAGAPLVSIPMQLEQAMLAGRIARLGAGEFVAPRDIAAVLPAAIRQVLDRSSYREAARRIADKYRGFEPARVASRIAATLEDMSLRLTNRGATA